MADDSKPDMNPRLYLDELHNLRTASETELVVGLAEKLWDAFVGGRMPAPVGLGAACQMTFIALMDVGREPEAQRWRARASTVAVQTRELNTIAMLLIPIAFMTNDLPGPTGRHSTDDALAVMDEIRRMGDLLGEEWIGPGVSYKVLRRNQHEKSGYLNWRGLRYRAALDCYEAARPYADEGTRDWVRLDAGKLLAELGIQEEASGSLDIEWARSGFEQCRDAADKWDDIRQRFARNLEAISKGRVNSVQDLEPVEVERRLPKQ